MTQPGTPAPAQKPVVPSTPDYKLDEEPEIVGDGQPRDEHGRFAPKPEPTPEGEPNPEPEPEPTPEGGEEPAGDIKPESGLTPEDPNPPLFGYDGKFVDGKFLGKHETIDDALQGYKHAVKRIGQLEYELSQARSSTPAEPLPFVYDPHVMSPDVVAEKVAAEIGANKEMTTDERIEFEENPSKFIAKMLVKGKAAMDKITETTTAWEDATRKAYPDLFDKAIPHGRIVFNDYKGGKIGPAEFQMLLGLGIMAREGKLSPDNQPVTRKVPAGRSPEVRATASIPKPSVKKDDRAEQKAELEAMAKAAYGI